MPELASFSVFQMKCLLNKKGQLISELWDFYTERDTRECHSIAERDKPIKGSSMQPPSEGEK